MKARVLATCAACGKPVFGRRVLTVEQARHVAGPAVRVSGKGVMHNRRGCYVSSPDLPGRV